ncbi:MAG TPA: hypothetical protein VMR45_01505 [Patescibacteria group bacterium]|nr:hypothetical protein [Patescibacteria group bacterium]
MVEEQNNLRPSRKRRLIILIAVLCCIILPASGVALYFVHKNYEDNRGIPKALASKVDFSLYYPHKLPDGMTVDRNSFSATPDVFMYTVNYIGHKKMVVSIMPLSSKPDVETFNPTRTLDLDIGKAYIATFDPRTTAAIITNKSWLLVNAENGIDDGTMNDLLKSLQ